MKIWKISRCRSRSPKCAELVQNVSFHVGVSQGMAMAKKYSKIYNADVQIFKVLNLSSQDGDAEDNFDCKNMNIYFKYEFCEKSLFVF